MSLTLLVTDRNLNIVGDPIANWSSVDATIKWNEPGSGTLVAPASRALQQQVAGGRRIVVIRNPVPALGYPGEIFIAGPVEHVGEAWSITGENAGPGKMTIDFADDLASMVGRITYPNPAQPSTAQTIARYLQTGNAELAMRALINLNCGPGALANRRVPKLILGDPKGITGNVSISTRFEPIGDTLRSAGLAAGGLGFRLRQVGQNLVADIYEPRDLSNQVRFSRGLGNLREYSYNLTTPTTTTAIVGGQDEGADRLIVERTDPTTEAEFGRYEVFVDQRQSDDAPGDTSELDQAGDEAIAKGAPTAKLVAVTVDTPTQRFGVHYGLSDLVGVELATGVEVLDLVRAVNLTATPGGGELVSPLVGSQEASSDPLWVAFVRDLAGRLARLETI